MAADGRFAHVASDPVFKKGKRRSRKVKVDLRFAAAVSSSRALSSVPDKYGRVLASGEDSLETEDVVRPTAMIDEGGEADFSSSSSSDGQDDQASDDDDDDSVHQQQQQQHKKKKKNEFVLPATHEQVACGGGTDRLAVTDCDWEAMRADDLCAILSSLCPADGRVFEVCVYLSEFGAAELEREQRLGPRLDDDEDDPVRAYEMSKLRRYFAIARFDTVSTAERVYAHDGCEVENSAPLRFSFVDEAQAFDQSRLRDRAQGIGLSSYEGPIGFRTAHTKVECTWEADDEPDRKRALHDANATGTSSDLLLAPCDDDDDAAAKAPTAKNNRKSLRAQFGLDDDDDVDEDQAVDDVLDAAAASHRQRRRQGEEPPTTTGPPQDDFFQFEFALEPSSGGDGDDEATHGPNKSRRKKRQRTSRLVKESVSDDDDDDDVSEDQAATAAAEDPRFSALLRDSRFAIDPAAAATARANKAKKKKKMMQKARNKADTKHKRAALTTRPRDMALAPPAAAAAAQV